MPTQTLPRRDARLVYDDASHRWREFRFHADQPESPQARVRRAPPLCLPACQSKRKRTSFAVLSFSFPFPGGCGPASTFCGGRLTSGSSSSSVSGLTAGLGRSGCWFRCSAAGRNEANEESMARFAWAGEKERDVRERDIGQAICSKCDQAWLRGNIIFSGWSPPPFVRSAVPAAPPVPKYSAVCDLYATIVSLFFSQLSLRFQFCSIAWHTIVLPAERGNHVVLTNRSPTEASVTGYDGLTNHPGAHQAHIRANR